MGLKYVSSDSSNLMTALEQNITQIKSELDTLSTGASQLVLAVDGRTLSGAAYTAASGLFSECIIPAIQKTKSAVDAIQTDLSTYKTQDGTVSGEGVLDEDELNRQLTSLKSQKTSAEQMSSYLSTQVLSLSGQKGTDYASYIGQLNSSITSLSTMISSLDSDITEVERKLKLLREFSANTSGLFSGAKDGLSVSMQAVMMLSQVTINSDGSYSFPAGDASWFTTKQKDVNNSLVYALYTMPNFKTDQEAVDWVVKNIEKYGLPVVKALLENPFDTANKSLHILQKILILKNEKIYLNGIEVTIDSVGRLRYGGRMIYKPSTNHKYNAGKALEELMGGDFKLQNYYDDVAKQVDDYGKLVRDFGKNSKFLDGLKFWDDFKGWKDVGKLGKFSKGLGILSTGLTLYNNIEDNTKDGKLDVVGTVSDFTVDLGTGAGAMATGAALGSFIAPPLGTVVGYGLGFAFNIAINVEFGNPPTSAVGHLKQFVKNPVGSFGKMSDSVGKAISGVGKWFGFGG